MARQTTHRPTGLIANLILLASLLWSAAVGAAQPVCSTDIDGSGTAEADTDGQLVMRHLFGFTGDALIDGVLGSGATRTAAADITAWLNRYECADMLDVDANGRLDGLTDGLLHLRYLSGYRGAALTAGAIAPNATRILSASIETHLAFYGNLGTAVVLQPPDAVGNGSLLSGIPANLRVTARYNGRRILRYELLDGPSGMTIDARSGALTWVPPVASEGTTVDVQVFVTDDEVSDSLAFSLSVAKPEPIAATMIDNRIVVTEPGSLQGFGITLPSTPPPPPPPPPLSSLSEIDADTQTVSAADFTVAIIPPEQAPPVPDDIIRVSDFFRTTPLVAEDGEIRIQLPPVEPPPGYSRYDLALYIYEEPVAAAVDGPIWVSTRRHLSILPDGMLTIELGQIGKPSFVGIRVDSPTPQPGALPILTTAYEPTTCTWDEISYGGEKFASRCCDDLELDKNNVWRQLLENPSCQIDEDGDGQFDDEAFSIQVYDFSTNKWKGSSSIHELVGWLYSAKMWFDAHGFAYEESTEIRIAPLPRPGWVLTSELWKTIHLDATGRKAEKMMFTAVHEFFHQAQAAVRVDDQTTVLGNDARDWIAEGTAKWFEDEVFDEENSWSEIFNGSVPVHRILEVGLDAPAGDDEADAYARFAFWKLINRACGLDERRWSSLFDGDFDVHDATGADNLARDIASWDCDFGTGAGHENISTLGAALLVYQDATIRLNKGSLLDENEQDFQWWNPWKFSMLAFDQNVDRLPLRQDAFNFCSKGSGDLGTHGGGTIEIPANGAVTCILDGSGSVPDASEAVVRVNVSDNKDRPVWLTLVSPDAGFIDQPGVESHGDPAAWFSVTDDLRYAYARAPNAAPEVYAHLVNPNTSDAVEVVLSASYEDRPRPGAVQVNPPGFYQTTAPQTIAVSSENAESIYYTRTTTYNGSTPLDPVAPSCSVHDGVLSGPDATLTLRGVVDALETNKLRFVGCREGLPGPVSDVHAYILDLKMLIIAAPTLTAPPEGATDIDLTPTLQWQWGDANFWRVTIASNGATLHNSEALPVGQTSYAVPSGLLEPGELYIWTVTACDTAACDNLTDVSPGSRFTTAGGGAAPTHALNDTGIDWCANSSSNFRSCPASGYPWQDAEDGRDVTHNDESDGHAGFSFTKISNSGQPLPASAALGSGPNDWACTRDNVTGLVWEVKTGDYGLRDKYYTYTWYNPDPTTNGGHPGAIGYGGGNTHAYAQILNSQGLCGASDWRLPSVDELLSIVNNERDGPAIDTTFFPNTRASHFWSSSPYANNWVNAWRVDFQTGEVNRYWPKGNAAYVRLVRSEW